MANNKHKRDFSDFTEESFRQHNLDMRVTNEEARKWKLIKSKTEREEYTKKVGLRWSEFRTLPYYNCNRAAVVDGTITEHKILVYFELYSTTGMTCIFLGITSMMMAL